MISSPRQNPELLLYLLIVLGGGALRFIDLAGEPLTAQEGAHAFLAWQLLQGGQTDLGTEPLIPLATAASFFLFGTSDLTARLVPALAGTAMVALPGLLRPLLGRWGGLSAAFLLAISPSLVYFSRHLTGYGLAAFFSLLVVASGFRYLREGGSHWLLAASMGLVGLLSSGSLGIATFLALALYAAIAFAATRSVTGWPNWLKERRQLAYYGLVALAGLAVINTGLFSGNASLGLPSLRAWATEFNLTPDSPPWFTLPALALAYEPLILLFGLLAAVEMGRRLRASTSDLSSPQATQALLGLPTCLSIWAISSLPLFLLSGPKNPGLVLSLTLPLTVLSGHYLGRLVPELTKPTVLGRWRVAAVVLIPFVFGVTLLNRLSLPELETPGFILPLALLGIVPFIFLMAAPWHRRFQSHATSSLAFLLLLLGLFTVHSTFRLNHGSSDVEPLALPTTSRDVVELADMVAGLSQALYRGEGKLVSLNHSLAQPLAWYLRQERLAFNEEPDPEAEVTIVASEWGEASSEYTRFAGRLGRHWSPPSLELAGAWRWLLNGEVYGPWQEQRFIAYIRR